VHDVQLIHPSGLLPNNWRPRWLHVHERLYIRLMRFMMGSPAVVIFPSEFMLKMHERFNFFPKSTKVVVRNAVADFLKSPTKKTINDKFIFVGQLEKHKGILDLLTAWEQWEDQGAATLDIVGSGSLQTEIQTRTQKLRGVSFHGAVYGAQLNKLFAAASYLVLPSLVIENAPMVILDAFSHSLPVLAAKSGGVPELIKDGRTGFLFAPADTKALISVLRQAATFLHRDQLVENITAWNKSHTFESYLDALESIYRG
jgi:glycosyltransferase involved in cell wall biosynthesis